MSSHSAEIAAGERFEFGSNWAAFLEKLDESRIQAAEASLGEMLGVKDLRGQTFLDIGCGSGLFSLAARRLGAKVTSFDYDPASVACTRRLRNIFFTEDPDWIVDSGSVLDSSYMESLEQYDTVYSWGVLHHTGEMWRALDSASRRVKDNGRLFIAIYNDQGTASRRWLWVKRTYNRMPSLLRPPVLWAAFVQLWWRPILSDAVRMRFFATFREYSSARGMSVWRDVVDWVGGYPFEVARPEQIFEFYKARGFVLEKMKTTNGLG